VPAAARRTMPGNPSGCAGDEHGIPFPLTT
jgi:hypothetical protein